jgi:hypothetical protein
LVSQHLPDASQVDCGRGGVAGCVCRFDVFAPKRIEETFLVKLRKRFAGDLLQDPRADAQAVAVLFEFLADL